MGSFLTLIHICFPSYPNRQVSACDTSVVEGSEDAAKPRMTQGVISFPSDLLQSAMVNDGYLI